MNKAVYIATTEAKSGKSIISLGLMQMLLGKTAKVGYFKPIIDDNGKGKKDNHIDTILSYFDLQMDYEETYAFTRSEVVRKTNKNKEDEIITKSLGKNVYRAKIVSFTISGMLASIAGVLYCPLHYLYRPNQLYNRRIHFYIEHRNYRWNEKLENHFFSNNITCTIAGSITIYRNAFKHSCQYAINNIWCCFGFGHFSIWK